MSEIRVKKFAMVMRIAEEPEDRRTGHLEPPTPQEQAEHDAWRAAFEPLYELGIARGWYRDGGPDYGPEYEGPHQQWVWDE